MTPKSMLASAFSAEFKSVRVPGVQVAIKTNQGDMPASYGKPFNPETGYSSFDDSFDFSFV